MAGRPAKTINARPQVTRPNRRSKHCRRSAAGSHHIPRYGALPLAFIDPVRASHAVAAARDALGPDEYTRLAAIGRPFSASDPEDYMFRLAEEFP
jgi:hypothetical protein